VKRKVCAIVPAAGSGKRFGPDGNKLFLPLSGKPALLRTLETLQSVSLITDIIPVVKEEELGHVAQLVEENDLSKILKIVPGGAERQDSVYNALKTLDDDTTLVLIHDGGRPFATADIFTNAIVRINGFDGVIAAVRVKDTIKEIEGAAQTAGEPLAVRKTLERDLLYAVQTPQVFPFRVIIRAHEEARREKYYATDDAALVERYGGRIGIIEGSYRNIKITTPEDMIVAEALLKI
jgi:2-C-methyl-D-erythritol 4-phosphate cytidylyltransferase